MLGAHPRGSRTGQPRSWLAADSPRRLRPRRSRRRGTQPQRRTDSARQRARNHRRARSTRRRLAVLILLSTEKGYPPDEWEMFGGAPAFVVSKTDGSVRVLSWDEYC